MYGNLSQLSYSWDLNKQKQKRVENSLKSSVGMAMQTTREDQDYFYREGGSSYYVIILCCETLLLVFRGTVKGYVGHLFSLYYSCFTCFVSIQIGKVKSAIESVLKFLRLTLNYSVCICSFCLHHPCDTNTFTHCLTRMHLLQQKQKFFDLSIKEISTLKLIIKLFLIKLSADISEYFQTFQQVIVFYFF